MVAFLHNRLPNSRCLNSLPHQELFGTAPPIATLYPFGEDAIVHVPSVNQPHKLVPRGIECKPLKPLMSGGWLLWEPSTNKMVQSASIIFPQLQPSTNLSRPISKGSLGHVVSTMSLGEFPTERLFAVENQVVDSLILVKDINIPEQLSQALLGPHREKWREACLAELDQMSTRDVWEAVEKKPGIKTIGHRWVFDIKQNVDGSMDCFKARLVARGDRQQPGVDCAKTYTLTASLMSLHLVLPTAALRNWKVASFDVSGAYLYSPVEETVLVEPPVDFLPELQGKALRLKKVLYEVNQSLYIFQNEEAVIAIWVHVDDGVIISNSPDKISDLKTTLCAGPDIKWADEVQQIVGLKCTIGEGEVAISQRRLTNSILDAYPRPVLRRDSPLPMLPVGSLLPDEATLDPTPFQYVIGSLAYLVSGSRPDLAFAMNYLVCHSMGPTATHWDLLDHVIGYLFKTRNRGINLRSGTLSLNLWSNAGWGGDLKRSQTGFMIKLGNSPILWGSKRQSMVALSTCAAEYIALSNLTQHLVQAINQLGQLAGNFNKTIYCNNQAAVQVLIDNKSQKHMHFLDRPFFLSMIPLESTTSRYYG
ncbi:hypothetical protein O181_040855 [Austropuccinia psidii MF-1]|uniref:Reverse transcriptase Ty1/copia-type domain-containing protein n=1 Tax=Austropuccinia psidii MF-1 TaxID=1389203 RepID=A0A9Q3DHL9_9BASI|nr:hypothetical protein [Austropuccinia psidii MF-1]